MLLPLPHTKATQERGRQILLRILTAASPTAGAAQNGAQALVPPTSRLIKVTMQITGGIGYFQTSDDGLTDSASTGTTVYAGSVLSDKDIFVNSSQQFIINGSPTGVTVDVLGYYEELS
jgi:hypothetical protein